jgi:hypothetical protein
MDRKERFLIWCTPAIIGTLIGCTSWITRTMRETVPSKVAMTLDATALIHELRDSIDKVTLSVDQVNANTQNLQESLDERAPNVAIRHLGWKTRQK